MTVPRIVQESSCRDPRRVELYATGLQRAMCRVTVPLSTSRTRGCWPSSFERGDARRIQAALAPRIRRILSDLDSAIQPGGMDLPGYRLHPLTGDRRGQCSVRVSGNWRIVFRFRDGEAVDVTLIDYH